MKNQEDQAVESEVEDVTVVDEENGTTDDVPVDTEDTAAVEEVAQEPIEDESTDSELSAVEAAKLVEERYDRIDWMIEDVGSYLKGNDSDPTLADIVDAYSSAHEMTPRESEGVKARVTASLTIMQTTLGDDPTLVANAERLVSNTDLLACVSNVIAGLLQGGIPADSASRPGLDRTGAQFTPAEKKRFNEQGLEWNTVLVIVQTIWRVIQVLR